MYPPAGPELLPGGGGEGRPAKAKRSTRSFERRDPTGAPASPLAYGPWERSQELEGTFFTHCHFEARCKKYLPARGGGDSTSAEECRPMAGRAPVGGRKSAADARVRKDAGKRCRVHQYLQRF